MYEEQTKLKEDSPIFQSAQEFLVWLSFHMY